MSEPRDSERLIAYLRDCYQADSREQALWDLFSDKLRLRRILSGREELFEGLLGRLPVDAEWGEAARKMCQMYKRERSLIYAQFVIGGGHIKQIGRQRKICAPLLWFPARLEVEQVAGEAMHFVVPELDEPTFNIPLIRELAEEMGDGGESLDSLLADFPRAPWDAEDVAGTAQVLGACLPGLDTDPMLGFPALQDEAALKKLAKGKGWRCVPAAFCAVVDNSAGSRGVLFELDALRELKASRALRAFLQGAPAPEGDGDLQGLEVPALLSQPQEEALAAARRSDLSLVVGPPGTGKSFTSAALGLDCITRGGAVLYAARSSQALDVIAEKLEAMLGTSACVLRGGRRKQLRQMRSSIEDLLRGQMPLPQVLPEEFQRLEEELRHLERGIASAEVGLQKRFRRELKLGRLLDPAGLNWAARLSAPMRRRWHDWRLGKADRAWAAMANYQRLLAERTRVQALLLKGRMRRRMEEALSAHREELAAFAKALRARSSSTQERYFQQVDLKVLTKTFPIWLADLAGLHRILPLQEGLFDLLILDEATQSDMASALPAMQRARRAVVFGDPKQLRHVSFLARKRQAAYAEQHDLDELARGSFDYRERSLLDRCEDALGGSGQVHSLDEHFRSRPPLIDFSNRRFYSKHLKVMTRVPDRDERGVLEIRHLAGERNKHGSNAAEADEALRLLERWVAAERERPAHLVSSFGLLSPFRAQVDLLAAMLGDRLGAEVLERHDIRVGTAYSFQGEERDRMILSLVVDPKSSAGSLRYLNRPDVFNVSVTRARDRQVVLCSLRPGEAPAGSLLQQYLGQDDSAWAPGRPRREGQVGDGFAREVQSALVGRDCKVHSAFPLAGLELDLVATRAGQALGLDLVGHPGRFAPAFPLERYRTLLRAGLSVLPLTHSAWRRDQDACLRAIEEALGAREGP